MTFEITLPDDVTKKLEQRWSDLPRHILESLMADAYREGVVSSAEIQKTLGISRFGVHDILKRSGVYLNYDEEELERDLEAVARMDG